MNQNLVLMAHAIPEDRIPKQIRAAEDFAAYAASEAARLAERPQIDTGSINSPKELDAALKAAATLPAHDEQLAIARKVADRAEALIEQAWITSLSEVDAILAHMFNAASDRFTTAVTAAGDLVGHYLEDKYDPAGIPLRTAIDELDVLRGHRDRIASLMGQARTDVRDSKYTTHSRTLAIQDAEQWQTYVREVSNGAGVWVAAHRAGISIKWQTLEQQQAQPLAAAVIKAQAAMTATTTQHAKLANL